MPKAEKTRKNRTLVERIHARIADLPEGEKRAASLILENPGELSVWSATEVAKLANVSNATVSRLFKRLDYKSFEEARREARELRSQGSPLYWLKGSDTATPHRDDSSRRLQNEMQRIEAALGALPGDLCDRIAARLSSADRIRLYGFRNSHFLASYLAASLAQFRPGAAKLMPQGQTAAEGLAELGSKDVVFIVGFRRRPANFTQIVTSSVSTGACVILLTDPSIRFIPSGVEHTIICPVESTQPLDAYGGALVILRTIALKTAAALGNKGRRYLEQLESLRATLGELE